jgi:hypothetical protein
LVLVHACFIVRDDSGRGATELGASLGVVLTGVEVIAEVR